jgi:tRNA (guanine26-N2/guanine27-N2)-dimethyltransferase
MRLSKIQEGMTYLMVPDPASYTFQGRFEPSRAPVFYNPKMEFSRDMAILVLNAFSATRQRGLELCDPLAGSGARGVRFAKEVMGVSKVVIGDLNTEAIPIINDNVLINDLGKMVEVHHKDACLLLEEHAEPGRRFDYIDVDPFGTPTPFLGSALRALKNGGLLAITATDTAPLCGIYGKACFRKYGSSPVRTEFCHEIGLRIMIGSAVREALKWDFGTEVLLSYSVDHYFRAYLRCKLGAKRGDVSASELGHIFCCLACGWRGVHRLGEQGPCKCPSCDKPVKAAGPLWCGSLGDDEFMGKVLAQDRSSLNTQRRLEKMLQTLRSENGQSPSYYVIDNIASRLRRDVPPLKDIMERLSQQGYLSSVTHFHPKALKTSAPLEILTQIVAKIGSSDSPP